MSFSYNKIHNYVLYQSIWLLAIFGGTAYEWLLAMLIGLHLLLCGDWKVEAKIMILGAAIGLAVDTLLTIRGVFVFMPSPEVLPVPLWLAAIWFGFIGTLRHSLSFMLKRPVLMTLAAGILAPLSYLAAMRFGAVEFPYGSTTTFTVVSISWMVMTPIFIWLTHLLGNEQKIKVTAMPEQAVAGTVFISDRASKPLVFGKQSTII